jgi:SpoVK/Ycf46/Vps4 family AAA+-type ATPase
MVGTFLRLLEYYNGILILTSNRVKSIDEAFYSRISFAKMYPEHTEDTRVQIVKNLLEVYDIRLKETEVVELSKWDVNGRQLKNSIRLAQFLAKDEKREVTVSDINTMLDRVTNFASDLAKI